MTGRLHAVRLNSIQAARGIAALLVILFHCGEGILAHPKYGGHDPVDRAFAWGGQGVELFFAISGFIILIAHWKDIDQPGALAGYVRKRILRIYPTYWVVVLALLPVYLLEPALGNGNELAPLTLISSGLLVHVDTSATVLAVSWTLFYEVVFYAAFAFLIVARPLGFVVLACWWGLSIARLAGLPVVHSYVLSHYTVLFGFGMAAAFAYRTGRIRAPGLLAVGGTLGFVGNGLLSDYAPTLSEPAVSIIAGGAAAFALAGFAELERRDRLTVPAPLLAIGNASYSIYLVHFPVLSLLAKIALHVPHMLRPPLVLEFVMIVVAVATGLVFHRLVEAPLLSRFSRARSGDRPGAAPSRRREVVERRAA